MQHTSTTSQPSPKQLDLAAAGYAPAKHLPAYAAEQWRLREQRAAERAAAHEARKQVSR